MKYYNLKVGFDLPDEEELLAIFLHFSGGSFKYTHWKGIVPPNHVEFEFEHLSEVGVENVKARFRTFNLSGGNFTTVETYG